MFDCNDVISYSVESERYVTSFLVPYCYLARGKYKVEAKGKQSLHYETLISELVYNTQPEDNDLLFKMRAVANLLFIHSHTQVVTCQQNEEFNQIISFIHENTLNHDMDLMFISNELGMSKSKIQKMLRANNVSYRDLIKESRVRILASKLNYHKGIGVAQLCYDAGFNSPLNAATQFKKVMNVSISEYRKKHTNE